MGKYVAIYRRNGKITKYQEAKEYNEDVQEAVRAYNKNNSGENLTVEVVELDSDSLTAYLMENMEVRKRHLQEEFMDISVSLDRLSDQLRYWQDEVDKMQD